MYAADLLTSVKVCTQEVIDEKISLLAEAFFYVKLFDECFYDSRYVDDAKSYIFYYYLTIINDVNKEHDIYIAMLDYLDKYEYVTDLTNQKIISDLYGILDDLEESMYLRIEKYCPFREHLDQVLASGILTNSNYLFANYYDALSDSDVEELKDVIPRGV